MSPPGNGTFCNVMHEYIISLGSNWGDRFAAVELGIRRISAVSVIEAKSSLYETPEIHGKGSPYVNAILKVKSSLDLERLNATFKEIEKAAGRDANSRLSGDVPLDIDIVCRGPKILRPFDFNQTFFKIGFNQISG